MMLDEHFWYFDSVLTPRFCENVIKFGLQQKEQLARTGGYGERNLNKKEISNLKQKRNSDVVFLNEEWIYREIHPYINRANEQAGWNFKWEHSESIQFTKYKLNQYYDWHQDTWPKPYNHPGRRDHGMIRKLSVTCQLTDGSEYKGGELEFDFRNYDPQMRDETKHLRKATEILPRGSVIVFPSFLWHRVKPVTKGVRYSLVLWNVGYPYK